MHANPTQQLHVERFRASPSLCSGARFARPAVCKVVNLNHWSWSSLLDREREQETSRALPHEESEIDDLLRACPKCESTVRCRCCICSSNSWGAVQHAEGRRIRPNPKQQTVSCSSHRIFWCGRKIPIDFLQVRLSAVEDLRETTCPRGRESQFVELCSHFLITRVNGNH